MPRPIRSKSARTSAGVELRSSASARSSSAAQWSRTPSVIASTSAPFEPKWLKTVARATPARSAISAIVTASKLRTAKRARAASRMRTRWADRSRRGLMLDSSLNRTWTRVQLFSAQHELRGIGAGGEVRPQPCPELRRAPGEELVVANRAQGLGQARGAQAAARERRRAEPEARDAARPVELVEQRSEEHTSELQSLR